MELVEIIGVAIGIIGCYLSLREAMLKKFSEAESIAQKLSFNNDRRCDEVESLGRRNEANIKMLFFLFEFLNKHEQSQTPETHIRDISIPTGQKNVGGNNTQQD
ncbi:hypothetical protein [Coleofasciculus chthonoplastes]|uniref:hypothetical protein n=1 Tax=Coleofasciculus chthonoplastes TaxID=64178 RepID=UPI0032FD9800